MPNEVIVAYLAFALSLISAGASAITYYCGLRRQRKNATLDAYNRLQNEALDPLYINYTKKKIQDIISKQTLDEYKEEYKCVGTYIARIEHFCTGVNLKIYDKKTVFELAEGFLNGTIGDLISPIIEKKDRHFHGGYYENTEKVLKWLDEMSKKKWSINRE